jgi:hypothetical protein
VVGWWRPWFTDSWWKAILSSLFFVTFFGGTAQMLVGRFIPSTTSGENDKSTAVKLFSTLMFAALVFLILRSCA